MYTKRNMAGMGERRCSGLFMDFDQEDDELLDIPTKRLSLQVFYQPPVDTVNNISMKKTTLQTMNFL